ncbi:hypothetical protein ACSYAY_08615 [Leptospirillum ferriphilum]|jgi:hypothetical protein|uniref:Uncharacterized protein n=1 Tax=Leptospirillum sp. Group II '5-way CG' TaxID=419541 RepID=B6AP34_9BACT|nr:MAG: Hypothetical protein CGL2_11276026 [Leptospirillum sp. Group II '5-way CG']
MTEGILQVMETKGQEKEMTEKDKTESSSEALLHPQAKECMRSLARQILSGEIPVNRRLWSGAGVAVVYRRPHRPSKLLDWYPDPRFLVTPYAPQVSWIFEELWKGFRKILDSDSKAKFYERLADAALSCSGRTEGKGDRDSPRSQQELLLAILVEAVLFGRDQKKGSDGFPPASSGDPANTDRSPLARPETFLERQHFLERFLMENGTFGKNDGEKA